MYLRKYLKKIKNKRRVESELSTSRLFQLQELQITKISIRENIQYNFFPFDSRFQKVIIMIANSDIEN